MTTFSDLLNRLDNDELDRVVCGALRELSGDGADAIAVDGKTVRSTRPASGQESKLVLFAALAHDRAVVNNQIKVAEKSNEIPGMPELLEPLELDGVPNPMTRFFGGGMGWFWCGCAVR